MKTLILKILPLWLMLICAGTIQAQINTTAGSVTNCPADTVFIPVNVTNCNGIGAISLVLTFDNTKLTFRGYSDLNSALAGGMLIINATGNKVVISWVRTTAANLGNSTMVKLKFTATPSSTSLAWDTQTPGNCEYSDVNGNILAATYTDGTATINQPPLINTQPIDKTVLVGLNTSFSVAAIGTGLAYRWQLSTNNGTTWADLNNTAPYSGVTTATLDIANAQLIYNGYKFRCKLTGTCAPLIYTDTVNLSVIYPVTTTLPTSSFCPKDTIVPVTVTNFTGIAAFSLTFSYNTSCLTYTGYRALNGALSGGIFAINASGGKIYMTWSSTTAATFGNGTIVELLFTTATGTSPLIWDVVSEGNCEYVSLSGSAITSVFVNGSQTINALPAITANPVNKTIAKGQNTTFSAAATGTGLSYRWQVSINGGVSFTDLSNGGYYSDVTSSTMSITNAQLAISGYQYRCKVTGTCNPVVFSEPATLTVLPNVLTTCSTVTVCPDQVVNPTITVTDFIGIASFSLTLNYNSSVLTYTGYENLNAAIPSGNFTANAVGGKVYMTWSATTAATIAGGGVLVRLKFSGVPGASPLTWDTQTIGNCEYSDINGQVIFSTWTNGNATVNQPPAITSDPVNKTIYAGGSTTFSVAASGTGLGYLWQVSANGGTSWTNLTNTAPYSGANTATLTIDPAATGMNGYLYHCIVSGTCTPSVTSNYGQLTVNQAAITTTPSGVTNSCTGNLNISIATTNCSNVGSISLTMIYDTSKMSFEGYHSANAALSGGILAVNGSGNKIYMTWASTTALNIGAGNLIQYRFRADAGVSTTLTWDTQTAGACEYSDINGNVITTFYNTSSISTAANALIVNAGADIIQTGTSVQLNGSVTGGTAPYSYLWAPATALSNPAILNPIASPTATTSYTLTVNSVGCSGSDIMTVIVEVVPINRLLQNINLSSGTNECYDATNTITVAGSGTTFVVQSGGSAEMIAGQKISYLPGTRVYSGGYMHGHITTSGQYCSPTAPQMEVTSTGVNDLAIASGELFRVYPNPTSGNFTVELTDITSSGNAVITVFGSMGETIHTAEMNGISKQALSLSEKPAGIYFIRMVAGDKQSTRKIIRK